MGPLFRECSAAILRPPEVETSRVMLERAQESDIPTRRLAIDDRIEQLHEMLRDQARNLGIPLRVSEYQLHDIEGQFHVVSRKRAGHIRKHPLLATIDPTAKQFAFVAGMLRRPVRRGVVAFTSRPNLENHEGLLGAMKLPIFAPVEAGKLQALQKVFALHMPINDGDNADASKGNEMAISRALLFPKCPTFIGERSKFTQLQIVQETDREAQPEVQYILRG